MHKLDKMTPLQRMMAFQNGQEMDRIMVMPVLVSIAHRAYNMSHKEKRSTCENQAMAQIACYERFGNDLLIVEYGLHGVGSALGTVMTDPIDSVPAIKEHVLKSLDEIDSLDFNKTTIENDPWFKLNLDAAKICIEKYGNEVPTGVLISGPFTACSSIYPLEKLLKATRKEPQKVHKLMRKVTDALKPIYHEFIKNGVIILECDPIASGTILQQKQYVEFVKPYATELADFIKEVGGVLTYHICGNTSKMTEDMVDTGCHMLSIDNVVDLESVKKLVGHRVPILGNVDPIRVLMQGTKEEIFNSVRNCIRKCHDSKNGYILASGCDITQDVPLQNIEYFMEAARHYGKMPLDLELLEKEYKD